MRARTINEKQNFERVISEPSDLGLGRWKPIDDIMVPLYDFEKNGGILEKEREIWAIPHDSLTPHIAGYYLRYDSDQEVHLMHNSNYRSTPIPPGYGVKIKAKALYK